MGGPPGVNHLDPLASERDGATAAVGRFRGHDRGEALGRRRVHASRCFQRGREVLMPHQLRRVVEDGGARRMVLMVMAVKDVPHRRVGKAFRQLRLDPRGRVDVNRIGQDDPGRGDEEDRVVLVVLNPVQITGDAGNAANRWPLRLLGQRRRIWEDGKRGDQ